jgi:hypothetical protein
MDTKICSKCNQKLVISEFHKRNNRPNGYASQCKSCRSISRKGKYKEYKSQYYLRYKDRQKELQKQNKNRINSRKRIRSKELAKINPNYKIKRNLRHRFWSAVSRDSKKTSVINLIGCTIDELKIYLSQKFTDGMNWENYGEWHIDHIIPCASFDLTEIEQQKQCFHYTNLQPLWCIDNILKSDNL